MANLDHDGLVIHLFPKEKHGIKADTPILVDAAHASRLNRDASSYLSFTCFFSCISLCSSYECLASHLHALRAAASSSRLQHRCQRGLLLSIGSIRVSLTS